MKGFFYTLFGGMGAVIIGIGIAYGGSLGWDLARPYIPALSETAHGSISSVVATARETMAEGTSISGIKRTIRYTASEEENLINAAARALPTGSDLRITAPAYIVKNLTLGDVTTERDADRIVPIASITKLATAVVARRLIDPGERIVVGPKIMSTYGNTAGFRAGEVFRASDLMYPLLMVSSNDAAEAYALAYGRDDFIKAINDWAQSIGAYRTYFADASGLSPDNVSTANDLAIILDWIHDNDPEILEITLMKSKSLRSHTWVNPTHFLSWSYYAGGKNGYTDEANRTTAALFKLGSHGNLYAVIALGSDNRDADIVKLLEKVRE